ncbi:MAG: hypothetical protein ACE5NM_06690 [Sedimentisphaerales bacterium]
MKRCVLGMVLAAMFLPAAVVAQEFEPGEAEFQMEMREREMELEQRQAEMELERRMGELELEKHKLELEHMRRKAHKPGLHVLLLVVLVVHILCAVWVYQDIRQRGIGSGIWIVIALLTGLLGTLVYAIVRLGNSEKKKA